MSQNYELIRGKFLHVAITGKPYEIGQQLGNLFRFNKPFVNFLSSGKVNFEKSRSKDFNEFKSMFEDYCPGINEELQGLAEVFDVDPSKMIYYSDSYSLPTTCSHVAILPSITKEKHAYVGRSYEWTQNEEDLVLATTKPLNAYSHIGFTCLLSGRHEGINEHGLTITASGGGIFNVPTKNKGLRFWFVIRSLLEQCKTVDEAKELIMRMPLSQFNNFLIIDDHSKALLVESADGEKAFKEIDETTIDEQFISATNHYTLQPILEYNKLNGGIISHSKKRTEIIKEKISNSLPEISKEDVKKLFSERHPKGLCDHHYKDYYGTLWSMIFDIQERQVDICFGAPTHNEWKSFNLHDSVKISEYPVIFPNVEEKDWL